ncbi:AIPR family protein [Hymenobacter terrigena]
MDKITSSLINELLRAQELKSECEAKDFEKLVNYACISNEYNKLFDLELATIGSGNDTGIDGIAIIVNGNIVESIDEVDDLLEANEYLEVTYVLTQAKSSSSFNSSDINTFLFGVKDFFSESPKLVRNEDIAQFAELSTYIYDQASFFKKNPDLKLYYVTTGTWTNDQNNLAVINSNIKDLEDKNLFNKVSMFPCGAKELTNLYRKTKESNTATIAFEKKITIPGISGVSASYIGLLPFAEFKKIIVDENDKLKNVFEDNVRDFQGKDNEVNALIDRTIKGEQPTLFNVLNNGVTIVAGGLSSTGDNFIVKDYQIVNGCQTSNVLFNNRDNEELKNVFIPVKLIVTGDDEIKNQITLATNNQTAIKKEQLAALTEFQRGLERYYNAITDEGKLYYERRAKQYNTLNAVPKARIITIPIQIKSFSAMFLMDPHMVTSFFGSIVKKLNTESTKIFKPDHAHVPYYTSALAYYRLESIFRRKAIDSRYKKARFHLLMIFRILVVKDSLPFLNSPKLMGTYCDTILKTLSNEEKTLYFFKIATELLDSTGFDLDDKQHVKQANRTEKLIDAATGYRDRKTLAAK